MNPITHLLASWSLAEGSDLQTRDRAVVTWVGLAPDLDGLGVVPDAVARCLGLGDPALYERFHHLLLHGFFGAVVLSALGGAFSRRKLPAFLWSLAAIHVHLLCDFVGSRGPTSDDIWPVHYLGPFSNALTFSWSGQWPLNAWPNIAFTLGFIAFVFVRAVTASHSPVSLFSTRAHEAFVLTVQHRWRSIRGRA
jgi:inner membrane protein